VKQKISTRNSLIDITLAHTARKISDTRLDTEVVLPLNKVGHREITKKELVDALMNTDCGRDDGRLTLSKMLVRDLRKLAANLGINTTKLVNHRIKSGWAGKEKGLLQVLWVWERGGLMNPRSLGTKRL
jgi:hypothetical protein